MKRNGVLVLAISAIFVCLVDLAFGALPEYEIIDLGIRQARAINDAGQVVGKSVNHAFLWENGVMKNLGTLGGPVSGAYGINNAGQIVGVASSTPFFSHAFIWENGVMTKLGPNYSLASGINDAGQVVGHDLFDAWVWDRTTGKTYLSTLGGYYAHPWGINNSGQVVGNSASANYGLAVLWDSSGNITNLGTLGGYVDSPSAISSAASGINDAGQVVGYARTASDVYHAFLWESSIGMIDLGGGQDSTALAINDAGQVVGGYASSTSPSFDWDAFLWDEANGMINLNDLLPANSGWQYLRLALGINNHGQIVGEGYLEGGGQAHAFLMTPVDCDGDGLLNDWETNGIDIDGNGTVDLDLPAMGADPLHKDIFVEIDYMVEPGICFLGFCAFGHSHAPKAEAIEKIIDAFANAPISNPDGTTGINLHVDTGSSSIMNPVTNETWGTLSKSESLSHDNALGSRTLGGNYNWSEFDQIKSHHFSEARRPAFHYCIFAHNLGGFGGVSGISRGIGASNFIVSLGSWTNQVGTVNQQAGTFMHELGHNLGLRHGGDVDIPHYKPNFLSVMNYSFQTRGLILNSNEGNFDYSIVKLPDLDESSLNETVGLNGGTAINNYGTRYYFGSADVRVNNANGPIDWNFNGNPTETNVTANINKDSSWTVLTSYNDWQNSIFDGGAIGELGVEPNLPEESPCEELTKEEDDALITLYSVSMDGQRFLEVTSGASVIFTFTVKNIGQYSDSYLLNWVSAKGWADVNSVVSEVYLDPNEEAMFDMPVEVPETANLGEEEELKLIAVSQTNPNILDSAAAIMVVSNNPPVANAGPDQAVEQESYAGTEVTLDGSGSTDPDSAPGTNDDIVSFDWYEGDTLLGTGETLNYTFQLGSYIVRLVVTDSFGETDDDEVIIVVQDTTPPDFEFSVTPDVLWPANHEMVLITPAWTVSDICDESPEVSLVSIVMNESDETIGDGHTSDDIQVGDDGSIYLRAERSGTGSGRIYTITYQAVNDSGNPTVRSATVTVPHDQR